MYTLILLSTKNNIRKNTFYLTVFITTEVLTFQNINGNIPGLAIIMVLEKSQKLTIFL